MLIYILATCCVMLTAAQKVPHLQIQDEEGSPSLQWPQNYMVQLTQSHLVGGLMEDIVAWKTNSSSRVDYNKGAVKYVTVMGNNSYNKFKICPETRKNEYNNIKCHTIKPKGNLTVKMDDELPPLQFDYIFVGYEDVLATNSSKFENIERFIDYPPYLLTYKRTIWAVYEKQEDGSMGWTPLRYEEKLFNSKHGIVRSHTVKEYFYFFAGLNYVKDEVFNIINKSHCTVLDSNSDSITKNLMFIDPEDPEHVDHVFKSFKTNFQRQYSTDEDLRRNLLQNSMRLVSSANKKELGYKLSINDFSDRTPEEMKAHTGLLRRPHGKSGNIPFPYKEATLKAKVDELPEEYDMRLLGLVSPVKNQLTCGSCWSFPSTASVEGALARANGGRLMSLANQALIDCSWEYNNKGCGGGTEYVAYEWMMEYGLPTEEEYGSFKNHEGFCNIRNMTKLYPIKGYTDVTPFSTSSLKVALVNHGPLTVRVHAIDRFKLYSSGIFNDPNCLSDVENLNHSVTLVGYSVKNGELFWILKNSWGPGWGIDGYMHISAHNNTCGVETAPTYVVV